MTGADLNRARDARDLLRAAFGDRLLIEASEAARLLNLDARTVRAMARAGTMPATKAGARLYRFSEANILAYLEGGNEWLTDSTGQSPAERRTGRGRSRIGGTTSTSGVPVFTARPGKKTNAPRKRSSGGSGRK